MGERGILFKSEMVRAILDGRKTQTRRAFKHGTLADLRRNGDPVRRCPYGQPGDRLWVKETWRVSSSSRHYPTQATTIYAEWREQEMSRGAARGQQHQTHFTCTDWESDALLMKAYGKRGDGWRPSLFMPRWASRITLEVVSVRVERLQAITEEDARAEGVEPAGGFMATSGCWQNYGSDGAAFDSARASFRSLWESINGPESWDANPWVWRIEFRRLP